MINILGILLTMLLILKNAREIIEWLWPFIQEKRFKHKLKHNKIYRKTFYDWTMDTFRAVVENKTPPDKQIEKMKELFPSYKHSMMIEAIYYHTHGYVVPTVTNEGDGSFNQRKRWWEGKD